ncbi:MAG: hypothetical protein JSV09_13205 [Thermoplasmata archaeon]|nr:MAG: hypothetical protein JSV09_13205 [Thermoplasmata archaeon]
MVSQKFVNNLNLYAQKKLKNVLAGQLTIQPLGSAADKHKGLADDLKTRFIPFRKSEYEAEEYLFARFPVRGEHFSFIDFAAPILNVKGKSIQGIASFVTSIPYPVPETYVQRMVGLKYRLVPHKLVVEQSLKPKQVIKENMITYRAVNAIHTDKKLCNKLQGSYDCKVQKPLSKSYYKIKMDPFEYPPGMFSIVPYYGHSILIAKEAGDYGASVDSPRYRFNERFEAFSGVAKQIAASPQRGEEVGKFYMDSTLEIVLLPLLEHLKGQSK